jgi:hypothetical protein
LCLRVFQQGGQLKVRDMITNKMERGLTNTFYNSRVQW